MPTHSVDWGKAQRARRRLLGGEYFNVPTAVGPLHVQMEVELEFKVRLGTYSGDQGSGNPDAWADVERKLRGELDEVANRCATLLAQAAPKGASAERIVQIELFEGLEGLGSTVNREVSRET